MGQVGVPTRVGKTYLLVCHNILTSYTCQLFPSQRRETFFLPRARVSEDDPTIAEDFRKRPRKFRRIPKSVKLHGAFGID